MRKHNDLSGFGAEGRRGYISIKGREIESKIFSCSPHVFLQERRLDSAVYFSKTDGDDPAKEIFIQDYPHILGNQHDSSTIQDFDKPNEQ